MWSTKKQVLVSQIPSCNDLNYFLVVLDPHDVRDMSFNTDFEAQKLKTRYLIWKNPSYLAAPVVGNLSQIHVLVPKCESPGNVMEMARDQKLILNAPHWNRIGDVWIKGPNVMTTTDISPAVMWEPQIAGNMMVSTMKAFRARLPMIHLADYNVDMHGLHRTGRVSMTGAVVYAIPFMKPCTVVSVSTSIPQDCPMSSYDLMRKHWKNMYGLRLPKDEAGMLYMQVSFRWSSELYTYPIICLRSCNVVLMNVRSGSSTVADFVKDAKVRCPTLCSVPLDFTNLDETPLSTPMDENDAPFQCYPLTKPVDLTSPTSTTPHFSYDKTVHSVQEKPGPTASRIKPQYVPMFLPRKQRTGTVANIPKQQQKLLAPVFKPKSRDNSALEPKPVNLPGGPKCAARKAVKTVRPSGHQKQPGIKTSNVFASNEIFDESSMNTLPANHVPFCATDLQNSKMPDVRPSTPCKTTSGAIVLGSIPITLPKPRKNVGILPMAEVEALVHLNKLNGANIRSLFAFCKYKCIPVSSKANKDLLMQTIYAFYGFANQ